MVLGILVVFLALVGAQPRAAQTAEIASNVPAYTADGKLKFPARYREWTYLTSGVDMSYSPQAMAMGGSTFDNVFVNPESYRAFLATGTWPDKTVMVLEARKAGSNASINKKGHFQTGEIVAREVHVKDETRFPGKWAFFGFDNEVAGELFPKEASCYSCHEQHAAVDTTFVQFYPTLLPIAMSKKTLSAAYLKEEEAAGQTEKKAGAKEDYKP
jgi:hypothetical protein